MAFLGPNGAGKSTSLRMLTTLLVPTSGTATVAGFDVVADPGAVRQRIGYVGQGHGAADDQLVRDEVVTQGRSYGMRRVDAAARADELLDSLELTPLAKRKASTLSGGQRRRLDVAIGMVHAPRLLFLDEPSTGLDPAEPGEPLGAPRPAARGARDDDLPHDPLPRGGRCDGRAGPRHRRGPGHRRRHARGAEGRDGRRPHHDRHEQSGRCAARRDGRAARSTRRARSRSTARPSDSGRSAARRRCPGFCGRSTPSASTPSAPRSSDRRSTTSSSSSPAAASATPATSRPNPIKPTQTAADPGGRVMMLANHTGIVLGRQLRPMSRDPFTLIFGVLQPIVFLALYGPLLVGMAGCRRRVAVAVVRARDHRDGQPVRDLGRGRVPARGAPRRLVRAVPRHAARSLVAADRSGAEGGRAADAAGASSSSRS